MSLLTKIAGNYEIMFGFEDSVGNTNMSHEYSKLTEQSFYHIDKQLSEEQLEEQLDFALQDENNAASCGVIKEPIFDSEDNVIGEKKIKVLFSLRKIED